MPPRGDGPFDDVGHVGRKPVVRVVLDGTLPSGLAQAPGAVFVVQESDDGGGYFAGTGGVDEEPLDPSPWYADADGDGYGAGEAFISCDAPAGYVADATDCDDADGTSYPGATDDRTMTGVLFCRSDGDNASCEPLAPAQQSDSGR